MDDGQNELGIGNRRRRVGINREARKRIDPERGNLSKVVGSGREYIVGRCDIPDSLIAEAEREITRGTSDL
jgi:hypothetical protein